MIPNKLKLEIEISCKYYVTSQKIHTAMTKTITAYQTLFTSVYFDCVIQSDTVNHCWNRI